MRRLSSTETLRQSEDELHRSHRIARGQADKSIGAHRELVVLVKMAQSRIKSRLTGSSKRANKSDGRLAIAFSVGSVRADTRSVCHTKIGIQIASAK